MDEDRAAQDGRTGAGASTSEQRRQIGPNTAQSRDERLKGLQGNAAGVVLNDEQRTRIRDTDHQRTWSPEKSAASTST